MTDASLYIAAAFSALVLLPAIWIFNRLVRSRHLVRAAWSDIDVQLKRRHDLIPKLVDVVKAYANFEQVVQLQLTRVRAQAQTPDNAVPRSVEENRLTHLVSNLFAIVEAYPDLKASRSFLELQENLSAVEDDIQYARRFYNGAVRQLNVLVEQFPSNLLARLFGFGMADYFEVDLATERQSPDLKA